MIRLPDKIEGLAKDIRYFHRPYATKTDTSSLEALRVHLGPELVEEAYAAGWFVLSSPEVAVMDEYQAQLFVKVWRQP